MQDLRSFRDDATNTQQTGGPREFRSPVGYRMGTSTWRHGGGEKVWDVEQSEGT